MPQRCVSFCSIALLFTFISSNPSEAAPFLLTASAESQIEGWLGQGNLAFTNIFEKSAGANSAAFHAAVDGKGATVTLLQATTLDGQQFVIGGYNPQSWQSSGGYHFGATDAERTAFIYNLTTGVMQTQRLTTDPSGPGYGGSQTFNLSIYGPIFGVSDLHVTSNLTTGFATQYAYGSAGACAWGNENIVGQTTHTPNCFTATSSNFAVGALEVYTFAPAQAPEPAVIGLLGMGLAGLAIRRRRR